MADEQVIRGFLASLQVFPPLVLEFPFNPHSVRDNKVARFETRQSACDAPTQHYSGGGERKISFSFELHGNERGADPDNPTGIENGIAPRLAVLRSFMYPRSDALADVQGALSEGRAVLTPPTCVFGFGMKLLECWVTSLSVDETQFNQYLSPVRASVSIELTVIEDPNNGFYQLDRVARNLRVGRSGLIDVARLLGGSQ